MHNSRRLQDALQHVSRSNTRTKELENQIDAFQEAQPERDRRISLVEGEVESRNRWLENEKKAGRDCEETLRKLTRIVIDHGFGGYGAQINVTLVEKIVAETPPVNELEMNSALDQLKLSIINLEIGTPLNGFQLFAKTVANPKSFVPSTLFAYLLNRERCRGYRDIAFFWVAVRRVLNVKSYEHDPEVALTICYAYEP